MGKVIINSDDFGYSYGVNYGIADAYQKGILTSTTLMANMPGFDHAVALKKELPQLGVGVHLTLTCGKPLLKNLDTLTEGDFFKKISFYQSDFLIDEEELYREWEAQIKKVIEAGIQPTHLDSHHHVHTFSGNQEIIITLAKKYNLPVRGNFERKNEVKCVDYFEKYFDDVGVENPEERQINEPIDYYLEKLLDKLRTNNTTEIMCHTAYIDKELMSGSGFVLPRINQVDFLISSEFSNSIRSDRNIELVTYKDI